MQRLCSFSLRGNLMTSLMLACNGVSLATLTLALAQPGLRCLSLGWNVRGATSLACCSCVRALLKK